MSHAALAATLLYAIAVLQQEVSTLHPSVSAAQASCIGCLPKSRHILVVSSGERPFSRITLPGIMQYAALQNASFELVQAKDDNELIEIVGVPGALRAAWGRTPVGRGNTTVCITKLVAIGNALDRGADKVLALDDTVFIPNPESVPDIFTKCAYPALVCGYPEGQSIRGGSLTAFLAAQDFLSKKAGFMIGDADMINGGVVVWKKGARQGFLSAYAMAENIELFTGDFVEQTFIAARLFQLHTPRAFLSEMWNYMMLATGDIIRDEDGKFYVSNETKARKDIHFFHATGYHPHEDTLTSLNNESFCQIGCTVI